MPGSLVARLADLVGIRPREVAAAATIERRAVAAFRRTGETAPIVRAVARWGAAADRFATAGAVRTARGCAGAGAVLGLRTVAAVPDTRLDHKFRLCEAVAAVAARHRMPEILAVAAATAARTGPEASLDLDGCLAWLTTARTALAELGAEVDPDLPVWPAMLDTIEGALLCQHGRYLDAVAPLTAALAVHRAEGSTGEIELCEVLLVSGVLAIAEPDHQRVMTALANQRWTSDFGRAMAEITAGTAALGGGDHPLALLSFARARRHAETLGAVDVTAYVDGLVAITTVRAGDLASATEIAARFERSLAATQATGSVGRHLLAAIGHWVRIELDFGRGDHVAVVEHLATAEEHLLASGWTVLAARWRIIRGGVHLRLGDPRAALDAVLPAVLAQDAARFVLPDAGRRVRWAVGTSMGFGIAYRAAAACGERATLAELLEVARSNGVPQPVTDGSAEDFGRAFGGLLTEPGPVHAGAAPGVLPGAASTAGATALGVPAHLRTPWNTIALAGPLDVARRYHDPVRADVVVDWTGR